MKWHAKALSGVAFALALLAGTCSVAATGNTGQTRLVDGFRVYYGLVPASRMRAFRPGSEEAAAHVHVPPGKHLQHLVVAIYDADTMARVTDAQVTARVSEPGFGWVEETLEPTALNGYLTWCGYFEIAHPGDARIEFHVHPAAPLSPELASGS